MDAMNEIGPLVSQVIPSHSAKSHDALGGIYSVNVFPLMHILSYWIKKCILLNYAHMFFYVHF